MVKITCGDLCCGGGGWIAQLQDFITPIWSIDNDPAVVAVHAQNYKSRVICSDIAQLDPRSLPQVDVLFVSPPCQQWSAARSKKLPARVDAEIGEIVCRYIEVLTPKFVFLENVRGYVRSKSLQQIENVLYTLGYWVDRQIVDAADFGVPQNRLRLILRAVRNSFTPPLPAKERTRGWYEAIADLMPELPTTELAPWQLKRLPPQLKQSFLIDSKNADPQGKPTVRFVSQPAFAVCASSYKGFPKAVLVERTGARSGGLKTRAAHEPVWTIRCAITTDGRGGNRHSFLNALLDGQVLNLNTRALARLQSFPDWYALPSSTAVAGRIIGNAVPPALARKIVVSTIFPLLD